MYFFLFVGNMSIGKMSIGNMNIGNTAIGKKLRQLKKSVCMRMCVLMKYEERENESVCVCMFFTAIKNGWVGLKIKAFALEDKKASETKRLAKCFFLEWNSESSLDRSFSHICRWHCLDVHPKLADSQDLSHRATEMFEKGKPQMTSSVLLVLPEF